VRDNLRHRADIEEAYLEAMAANEEIILAAAYFFPGVRFRHALVDAGARGVRVMLLLQARVEYVLLHYASRARYGVLRRRADLRVHEELHARQSRGDRRTLGHRGLIQHRPFSLLLARETNLVIEDRTFAHVLRDRLRTLINDGAKPVARLRWRRKPLDERVRIWVAYGVARFFIGWFGYARKH
jgi:cardiolipin synthase A/B